MTLYTVPDTIVVPDIFPPEWVEESDDERGVLIAYGKRSWRRVRMEIEFIVPGGWPRGPGYRRTSALGFVTDRMRIERWEIAGYPPGLYTSLKLEVDCNLSRIHVWPGDKINVDPLEITVHP